MTKYTLSFYCYGADNSKTFTDREELNSYIQMCLDNFLTFTVTVS